MKNRRWLTLVSVMLIFIFFGSIYSCRMNDAADEKIIYTEEDITSSYDEVSDPDDEADTKDNEAKNEDKTLCVYVCGGVNNAGIYYLGDNARVNDAINAAGGFSDGAAKEYINLAAPVADGDMIFIPDMDSLDDDNAGALSENIDNVIMQKADDGLIDINNASKEELKSLPGIGDVKAEAIIDYRNQNGDFSSIEDLMNVNGIGKGSFDKIKEYIKV